MMRTWRESLGDFKVQKREGSFLNLRTPDAKIKEKKSIFTCANSFEILENAFSLAIFEHFCPWV
jgi:hypothetical protein